MTAIDYRLESDIRRRVHEQSLAPWSYLESNRIEGFKIRMNRQNPLKQQRALSRCRTLSVAITCFRCAEPNPILEDVEAGKYQFVPARLRSRLLAAKILPSTTERVFTGWSKGH